MNDIPFDLNLMLVFEAMTRERSVTRAAVRLGIGQPAASNALARLRLLFKDELFVREGRTMVPTAKAIALIQPIESALATIRSAIAAPATFQASTAARTFRISAGDYATMMLLPPLIARLRDAAPRLDLRVRFVEKDKIPDLIDNGELDLAIGVFPSPPKRFVARPLLEEVFVCLARRGHPDLTAGLTLDAYASLPHVLVTEAGDETGAVDGALRTHGRKRRVALTVPHVLLVPLVVQDSDVIATVGARAARRFAVQTKLAIHAPPIALPPWRLSLMFARRVASDAGIAWLCGSLIDIAAEL